MDATDIEGTKPGWRQHNLFVQPRDSLRVADICAPRPSPAEKHRQLVGGGGNGTEGVRSRSMQDQGCGPGVPAAGGAAGGFALPMSERGIWPQAGASSTLPEYGVAYTADWHKQRAGAKIEQGEAARQAQQAADAAIAAAAARASAAAAAAASSPAAAASGRGGGGSSGFVDREARAAGMAGLMRSLKAHDREKSGRVQVGASEEVEGLQASGVSAAPQAAALALQ